jgi:hypothetical protein
MKINFHSLLKHYVLTLWLTKDIIRLTKNTEVKKLSILDQNLMHNTVT